MHLCFLFLFLSFRARIACSKFVDDDHPTPSDQLQSTAIEHRKQDSMVVQLLAAVRGNPQPLSSQEMRKLRATTPRVVEQFVQLMNQESFSEDVSTGKVDRQTFEDLTKSLVFLESAQCSLSRTEPTQTCLILRQPISFPTDPVVTARLFAFIRPQSTTCDVQMKLYFLNEIANQFTEDVFHLTGLPSKPFGQFSAITENNFEASWDITAAVADLKQHLEGINHPVIMTLECSLPLSDNPWDLISSQSENFLLPDRQVVIELTTKKTELIKNVYGQKRLSRRGLSKNSDRGNLCPSFMDGERHMVTCCLFEYTLTKQQLDANPKLRFIIFPQHLPLNMCHGRCIGIQHDWRNSHVMLLNRYFEGLPPEEREVLYDSMPCCAANQTAPFTIVYKNQNNQLTTETLPNAKKISCACG